MSRLPDARAGTVVAAMLAAAVALAAPGGDEPASLPALPGLPGLPDAPAKASSPGAATPSRAVPALPEAPAAGGSAASRGARADPAEVTRSGPLRQGPSRASLVILEVPEGTRVELTTMAGAWASVRVAGGQKGWMPVDSLRIGGETREASIGWLRRLTGALRRTGSSSRPEGGGGVSVGVRGLTADEVRSARPDMAGVEALERLAVTGPKARARAGEVGLASRSVPFDRAAAAAVEVARGPGREVSP